MSNKKDPKCEICKGEPATNEYKGIQCCDLCLEHKLKPVPDDDLDRFVDAAIREIEYPEAAEQILTGMYDLSKYSSSRAAAKDKVFPDSILKCLNCGWTDIAEKTPFFSMDMKKRLTCEKCGSSALVPADQKTFVNDADMSLEEMVPEEPKSVGPGVKEPTHTITVKISGVTNTGKTVLKNIFLKALAKIPSYQFEAYDKGRRIDSDQISMMILPKPDKIIRRIKFEESYK
jgi:hypothetical protein